MAIVSSGGAEHGAPAERLANHLLHFLPHSLTSYPVHFPSSVAASMHFSGNRSVSSTAASTNILRPGTPLAEREKALRKTHSSASLQDDATREKETGFAKFLASKRPQPQPRNSDVESKAGVGEGKEVERDGYCDWTHVLVQLDGHGLGHNDESIDVSCQSDSRLIERSSSVMARSSRLRGIYRQRGPLVKSYFKRRTSSCGVRCVGSRAIA
jgi:hypothetical protein